MAMATAMTRPRARRAAALGAAALVSALALSGCGVAEGSNSNSAAAGAGRAVGAPGDAVAPPRAATSPTTSPAGAGAPASLTLPPTGRSLIYTGEVQLRTPAVDSVVARVTALVAASGGYIDSEVTGTADELTLDSPASAAADGTSAPVQVLPVPAGVGGEAAQLVVRIPVAGYADDYQRLLGLGTVLDQERSTQDVTQQVVDVASRLKTEQASVDRVRALMDQATDINEVISLESALTQRESALESLEAQQQALQSETSMSTVTVQVYQQAAAVAPPPAKKSQGAGSAVWGALKDGWHGLYLAFRGLLVALAAVLPFAAVLLPLGWLVLRVTRRYRRRGGPATPEGWVPPRTGESS
jgi:hypothetical protein